MNYDKLFGHKRAFKQCVMSDKSRCAVHTHNEVSQRTEETPAQANANT